MTHSDTVMQQQLALHLTSPVAVVPTLVTLETVQIRC